MRIKDITIRNFRSLYGEHFFDFNSLDGLTKLSGVIGVGKTSLGEAILFGLFGKVREHNNPDLCSWHIKKDECFVELNMISKNKEINIKRSLTQPLEVTIDGRLLSASNKKDTQEILEEEYYDVPKLAIEKMCIISFNAFKNSLAAMNPGETRQFLDDIFGFKTFTEYNNQIVLERKQQIQENNQLNTILNETRNQIDHLNHKKQEQQDNLHKSIDIAGLTKEKNELIEQGIAYKQELQKNKDEFGNKIKSLEKEKIEHYNKKLEYGTLGKQEKEYTITFKTGKCPTCGHEIDPEILESRKKKMFEYAELYKKEEALEKEKKQEIELIEAELDKISVDLNKKMSELREKIGNIESQIKIYNNSVDLLNENYDNLIKEYQDKITEIEEKIKISDENIGQWNDMNELFSKTLRYSLLDTLIPHINKSIKYYMNQLNQLYVVEFDQEFKPHIYFDGGIKEIKYTDLSTGQKKTLDIGIIFGVIANVISNVDFNIFFLDELMSNMDSDSRNIMLGLLKENLREGRSIFVVNHAEMADDYFDHKIRVRLETRKIIEKKEPVVIYSSKYEKIF